MSKDKKNDMIGFKDFLDQQETKLPKRNTRLENLNHELLTFLERDANRLNKLIDLYEEKVHMIKNHPQDSNIIVSLDSEVISNKIDIIDFVKHNDCEFKNNVNNLLKSHFKNL
jgi:hypothetical protein